MRLVAVSLLWLAMAACSPGPSGQRTTPELQAADVFLAATLPSAVLAEAAAQVADSQEQPFLFHGDLLNGEGDCAHEYGFTFADVRSLGAVEGRDAEGRAYRCRYDSVVEKGAVEWTADCEVRGAHGEWLRVVTMMHTALEPSPSRGIDAYDAFWVRGIVDLESGAPREECAYGGQVVHRAEATLF
jgi:hypothetical protein